MSRKIDIQLFFPKTRSELADITKEVCCDELISFSEFLDQVERVLMDELTLVSDLKYAE